MQLSSIGFFAFHRNKRRKVCTGEKDITEKILADYNDVFADIVNVLLFGGKTIVDENMLESIKDKSQYKTDGEIHQEERDVSKVLKGKNVHIAFIGFEHQTDVDSKEALRVIAYDGAAYKRQLLVKGGEIYPVVTIVLYFGQKRWIKGRSLYDILDITDEWKTYVSDYKINIFEIAYLTPEKVKMFKSDFRIVADYFVQMRINKDYIPSKETIKHVDEVLKLMSVLTQDERFEQAQANGNKGGLKNMCEVLDRAEARGISIGEARGELKGAVRAYLDVKVPIEEIAKKLNISVEEVQKIADTL